MQISTCTAPNQIGRHRGLDLPSAAHNLLLTHPAEVAAALRAFCDAEG